jgi:methyl-accepting chemotaxis protein WspA
MDGGAGRPGRFSRITLSWRVSLLVAVLLVASAVISTAFALRAVQEELTAQADEAVGNVHASVAALLQAEYADIAAYRADTMERRKDVLRDVAAPLITSLDTLRAAQASGELTTEQAQRRALALLKAVRFGNDDYFFTYDRDLNAIAHPDARFQGRNLTDLQDADGKYVLQEIRDVALGQGSGFIDYRWERLNGAEPAPKLGYVFHYAPWDWIIGTGVYVDDIETEVAQRTQQVVAGLQRTFASISFSTDGFFFILTPDGEVVATGDPRVEAAAQSPSGQAAIEQVLAAAPAEPGVETEITTTAPWSTDADEEWSVRVSTTGGDPDWILVSAVPQDRLSAPARELALQLLALSLLVLLVGVALGVLLSRRITKPVDDVSAAARALAEGTFEPSTLDRAARRKDEVGDLARSFRSMAVEVAERERRLRDQVERLTVQIDRAKVAEEVQEITESDYFQSLKARSEELRRRDR